MSATSYRNAKKLAIEVSPLGDRDFEYVEDPRAFEADEVYEAFKQWQDHEEQVYRLPAVSPDRVGKNPSQIPSYCAHPVPRYQTNRFSGQGRVSPFPCGNCEWCLADKQAEGIVELFGLTLWKEARFTKVRNGREHRRLTRQLLRQGTVFVRENAALLESMEARTKKLASLPEHLYPAHLATAYEVIRLYVRKGWTITITSLQPTIEGIAWDSLDEPTDRLLGRFREWVTSKRETRKKKGTKRGKTSKRAQGNAWRNYPTKAQEWSQAVEIEDREALLRDLREQGIPHRTSGSVVWIDWPVNMATEEVFFLQQSVGLPESAPSLRAVHPLDESAEHLSEARKVAIAGVRKWLLSASDSTERSRASAVEAIERYLSAYRDVEGAVLTFVRSEDQIPVSC